MDFRTLQIAFKWNVIEGISGVLFGLVVSSYVESFFHEHLGHATSQMAKWFTKIPVMGKWFVAANERHKVTHHSLTYKGNQITQFSEEWPMTKVDAEITRRGNDNLQDVKDEDYGKTLNFVGFIKFCLPFITVLGTLWLLLKPVASSVFCDTMLMTFFVGAAVSKWIHPCFHLGYDQKTGFMKTNSRLLDMYMNSSYGKFLWVYHEMHHRNPGKNFNLMLFGYLPVGDMLRGSYKLPTIDDFKHASLVGGPQLNEKKNVDFLKRLFRARNRVCG